MLTDSLTGPGEAGRLAHGQLTALVKTRLKQIQYRPGLVEGFLAKTGLDLTPFSNPTIKDLLASGCCEGVQQQRAATASSGTDLSRPC